MKNETNIFFTFWISVTVVIFITIIVATINSERDYRDKIKNAECIDGKLYSKSTLRDKTYVLINGYTCKDDINEKRE